MDQLAPDNDAAWLKFGRQWEIRPDTTYLNHGSFGPPPRPVRLARQRWRQRLDEQPMDFFLRQYEPAWFETRARLAGLVGTAADNLVLTDNATLGMNVVADSFTLEAGDEVLLNDHEYGAVVRIWERACQRAGTAPPRIARLPNPLVSTEQVVESLLAEATAATRMIVVSHITSATAVILPVREICEAARRRNIAVCIDGPHAPVQTSVDIDALGCDFYTASCHKWLCAPFGSGFLYVAPRHQSRLQPPLLSWGRGLSEQQRGWEDEFIWSGTQDPSAHLAISAAVEFMEQIGIEEFQARSHFLARYARQELQRLTGLEPIMPDSPQWYGSMAQVPLPRRERMPLQRRLWNEHGIEVPIIDWNGGTYIRVSCHLYNTLADIDRLVSALDKLLASE